MLADQGTCFYGMAPHRLPRGVTFVGQPLWASIGYTLPALLGACTAQPGTARVLLIGDGAAQMTAQELATVIQQRLPAVVVVVDNDGYTVERAIHGPDEPYNDITHWDWTHAPAFFGAGDGRAAAATVRTVGELRAAFADAAGHADRLSSSRRSSRATTSPRCWTPWPAHSATRSGRRPMEIWLHGFPVPRHAAALAMEAEERGFDGLMLADSENLVGDPYVELALAARDTTRLRLAVAVTNPVTRHPAVTASAIATLQIESGGRAVLVLGRGDSAVLQLGIRPATTAQLERAVGDIRAFLRGDDVPTVDGASARMAWIAPFAPAEVPVSVAATGPATTSRDADPELGATSNRLLRRGRHPPAARLTPRRNCGPTGCDLLLGSGSLAASARRRRGSSGGASR